MSKLNSNVPISKQELLRLIKNGKKLLETKVEEESMLAGQTYYTVDYTSYIAWKTQVLNYIKTRLNEDNHYYIALKNGFHPSPYASDVELGIKQLSAIIEDIDGGVFQQFAQAIEPLTKLAILLSRFHLVAIQLRRRYDDRPTLDINDEYDVQDLLHSLLKIDFDDIRPEEWTPSYAGNSSRVDFLLKEHDIIVEVKKTRSSLKGKDVANQLIIDIERYRDHPNCKNLVCFVYDPDGYISNPKGFESDLNRVREGLNVIVVVRPIIS